MTSHNKGRKPKKVNYPVTFPVKLGERQSELFKNTANRKGHNRSKLIRSWIDKYIKDNIV